MSDEADPDVVPFPRVAAEDSKEVAAGALAVLRRRDLKGHALVQEMKLQGRAALAEAARIRGLTDKELADELICKVWAKIAFGGDGEALIEEVIDRLDRRHAMEPPEYFI